MRGPYAVGLQILLGVSVLLFGRRLFWLFVAAVGFIAGALLAGLLFRGASDLAILIVAAAFGVLGALSAVLLQRLAIAVSGFIAGGYISVIALQHWGWKSDAHVWLPFIAGGIIGALLLSMIFDPALIVLSSVIGSVMVVRPLALSPVHSGLFFILLAATGMIAQTVMLKGTRRPSK